MWILIALAVLTGTLVFVATRKKEPEERITPPIEEPFPIPMPEPEPEPEPLPKDQFYMPSRITVRKGGYCYGLGTKIVFLCPITNKGKASGTHKLTFVGFHEGAEHHRIVKNIALAPEETYLWRHDQWLRWGNYKATLVGDWLGDNKSAGLSSSAVSRAPIYYGD